MKNIESVFPKAGGYYLIELRLNDLKQFFNTFDPSPFHDKDIDNDAERYIVESVRAFALPIKLKFVFYLPPEHGEEAAKVLPLAIDNYFSYRSALMTRELRATFHEGKIALVLGTLFLSLCVGLRALLGLFFENAISNILEEGFNIIGWVAMWRPIQIFLYDWWALLRQKRVYEKIRTMPLEIRTGS